MMNFKAKEFEMDRAKREMYSAGLVNYWRDKAEKAEAALKVSRANEAVCHCGSRVSEHTPSDNHGAVEMRPQCPTTWTVERLLPDTAQALGYQPDNKSILRAIHVMKAQMRDLMASADDAHNDAASVETRHAEAVKLLREISNTIKQHTGDATGLHVAFYGEDKRIDAFLAWEGGK